MIPLDHDIRAMDLPWLADVLRAYGPDSRMKPGRIRKLVREARLAHKREDVANVRVGVQLLRWAKASLGGAS